MSKAVRVQAHIAHPSTPDAYGRLPVRLGPVDAGWGKCHWYAPDFLVWEEEITALRTAAGAAQHLIDEIVDTAGVCVVCRKAESHEANCPAAFLMRRLQELETAKGERTR